MPNISFRYAVFALQEPAQYVTFDSSSTEMKYNYLDMKRFMLMSLLAVPWSILGIILYLLLHL